MKSGFVSILGRPNAGKSSLLNAIMGEKLAIVSSKVQTTRHRIKAILTEEDKYQIIFSDTPGIINPKYKLHERMMQAVSQSLQDADLLLFIVDATDNYEEMHEVFSKIKANCKIILIINKIDIIKPEKLETIKTFFGEFDYGKKIMEISATKNIGVTDLVASIVDFLPENPAFFDGDSISDLPTRFFVGELIREKIYSLYEDELPYQTTVLVQEYTQKSTLIKIRADIIVQRESQKAIILGHGGCMIKEVGSQARVDIEQFIDSKVFLELFVKVRPHWRDNELFLREYGYQSSK